MGKQVFFLAVVLCLALSGCSTIKESLENEMLQESGVTEGNDYLEYRSYNDQGKLNQQGYYSEDTFEGDSQVIERPPESTHISFATNNYLEVAYFTDANFTVPLDTTDCNFAQGDCIYATASVNNAAASSMYAFWGFYIYQYDGENYEQIAAVPKAEDGLVMQITSEQIGSELSIAPVGAYKTRTIMLQDYYTDDNGNKHDLPGVWFVDDQQCTDSSIEINPVSAYIVSYEYDSNEYFFMTSEPQCYYNNNADGVVIFERRKAMDESTDYSVELRKYVAVDVPSNQSRTVSVNDGEQQTVAAGNELKIPKLKYGDTVTIVTNREWVELANFRELILQTEEDLQDGTYRYTLTVPQKGGEFVFDPAEYSYEHGTIIFKCFGEEVKNTQYLAVGSKITYEQGTADEGYQLADGEHVIEVGSEYDTKQQLNNIHFIQSVQVTVKLEQPQNGGRIRYFASNGKEISTGSYTTTSGTEIKMDFSPWVGWINHFNDGEVYKVTEDIQQTATVQSKSVNEVFSEDPEHMPTLEVVLDKSVGENMQFSFAASGLDKNSYQYEDGWFRGNYTVIKPTKIGTETGITLSMGNRALQPGTAIKVLVEKEDIDKKKTSEYRLVDDLTELQEPILIYSKNELGISKVWYKSIKIIISIVDVLEFSVPSSPANAVVSVKSLDTLKPLKQGDILEENAKVVVTITPNSGYYVSGKDVKNDVYQSTIKFSKYQSDIDEIIDKHPIEKYYQVTLDSNDPYGVCTYKLDGDIKVGTICVKEDQKLTLEYKITSPGYVIEGAKGIVFDWGKNDQSKTESITITAAMDGQTINRGTFGIQVVKEG